MEQVESMLKELWKHINSRFDGIEKKLNRFDAIEKKLEQLTKVKEVMDGDQLLDNQDICLLLGITKRSLARYRHKKLIPYYQGDRKTYYKASEVREFLKKREKQPEQKNIL